MMFLDTTTTTTTTTSTPIPRNPVEHEIVGVVGEGDLEGGEPSEDASIVTRGIVALLLESRQLTHEQLPVEPVRHSQIFYLPEIDGGGAMID